MELKFIYVVILIVVLVSIWKLFEKAGRKGWEGIIPIYNAVILMKIIKKPWYWVPLMFIPYVGIIWSIWSTNLLSKSFGKGIGYTLGLVFLPFIFMPLLAFGDAKYTPLDGEAVEPFESDLSDAKSSVGKNL